MVDVTLNNCPPGLFWFGETLGFKSEYTSTLENPRRYQCDAYVVESGEYFHGGARSTEERGRLMVRPIEADILYRPAPESHPPRNDAAVEALREARRIIAGIDDYMKRPDRGDWGAECACCMGELLDDDRQAIAQIDTALASIKQGKA